MLKFRGTRAAPEGCPGTRMVTLAIGRHQGHPEPPIQPSPAVSLQLGVGVGVGTGMGTGTGACSRSTDMWSLHTKKREG